MRRVFWKVSEYPKPTSVSIPETVLPESKALVRISSYLAEVLRDQIIPTSPYTFVTPTPDLSVTRQEKYFYGVTEKVKMIPSPDGNELMFDLSLSRYVKHTIGDIIYRLFYGEPIMGVGVGVKKLIGSKMTDSLNIMELYLADTIGRLIEYGWKGQIVDSVIQQSQLNRMVIEIHVESIEPIGEK